MSVGLTDADRYDELASAARRVIRVWETGDLAGAVNELRETLEIHGTDEDDELTDAVVDDRRSRG